MCVALLTYALVFQHSNSKVGPYTLLISIDGFRADYLSIYRDELPNILNLSNQGTRAEYMRPVFPSMTFTNHYRYHLHRLQIQILIIFII